MDDGRITDSQGRTVDFKNTVIILTSNLGSDINVGTGMVTIALASLIIGETLVGKRTMVRRVLGVVFGSCLYRFIVAVALRFNVPAAAMKLVSALIVAVAISMPAIRAKFAFEQRKHNARKEVH